MEDPSVATIIITLFSFLLACQAPSPSAAERHHPQATSYSVGERFSGPYSMGQHHQPVCVSAPKNLTFCDPLGWGTKMRLPNLLEHETIQEVQLHTATWQQLQATRCSPDLPLFLCSVLSPVCLDVIVPPCRSLCLSVRGSCEPIMNRHGYYWPKIIDCNKFPINKDMCISQHILQGATPDNSSSSDTFISGNSNNSSTIAPRPYSNEDASVSKKRKSKKNRPSGRNKNSNSTIIGLAQLDTVQHSDSLGSPTVSEATLTPHEANPTSTTTNLVGSVNESSHNNNQSSVDFIQLFCSTHSEWIIKTKISDSHLYRAQDKRKMKLRSYKQIYGHPQSNSHPRSSTKNITNHLVVYLTNTTLALTYDQNFVQANLFDNLIASSSSASSTTTHVVGSSTSHTGSPKNEKSQLYLLAGRTSPSTQQRIITMWMLWPRKESDYNQSKEDRLPGINQNLLKGYKEIKKRGVKVCNKFSSYQTTLKSDSSTSYKRDDLTNKKNHHVHRIK